MLAIKCTNIADAGLTAKDIRCMGITTQRNTFITWDKLVVLHLDHAVAFLFYFPCKPVTYYSVIIVLH